TAGWAAACRRQWSVREGSSAGRARGRRGRASYRHGTTQPLAAALLLRRGRGLGLLVVLFRLGVPADPEHARPEAALLLRRRLRRDVDRRRRRRDAARRRRRRRDGRILGARRRGLVLRDAEQAGDPR